jgi:TonB family protein
VKFKRGSTDVQFGRKHKIIRPRLGLAGEADMLNLRDPITLVLALTLDDTGKVIRVEVLKSSGSHNIDQACKVAAYQWWLEPTKDKTGKPIKDVVPFVIGFS